MNLFFIPRSPIKQLIVQTNDVVPGNGLPSFMGYGKTGALNRFDDLIRGSFRDLPKRHPSSIGGRSGSNIHDDGGKAMDISAKFIGNFILQGIVSDANGQPIVNCIMKLFRVLDDEMIQSVLTDVNGVFTFSLPNDSYKNYYFTTTRRDMANTVGITSHSLTPVQV